ncbi:MAG: phenylalanine--tRNA ligase subunit beta [Muribaculaceae bacterium]|nr:phenylalanine--tRNA ligase subunit beta [Muribaculaceae bacterium]
MNISYNWLKQYVDFSLSPTQLADVLTSLGLETGSVEEVESIRGGLRGIVIGKVLTCEEHPDSDHLHVTTVDLGEAAGGVQQIVCGAPNVAAGQTVVVATIGTTLYDGDKEFQIKKSKIRGVESFGMICAEDEIGIGTSHDGIMVIDADVAPGTPAAEYFKLTSDYVLEVDLTPNRIDAACHYGVARDLRARLGVDSDIIPELRSTDIRPFVLDRSEGGVSVDVEDREGCVRYCGVTMRNLKVGPSPDWLRSRLTTIGLRSINNVVDVANYVLHAIGQPLHTFDLAHVKGNRVVVKTVAEGTPFVTLDGVERKLNSADLMICNAEEPMCIAGVFGGLDSGVTDTTTDIFIESACFNPTRVRKTARRHGLSTDSSFRYERGVDPNLANYALKLAALLIKEVAGGEICGPIVDFYPTPAEPYPVSLSYKQVNDLIGKEIEPTQVDRILELLEIKIAERKDDGMLDLRVPTYRYDVRRPCDVIEEILRIYGYNNVEIKDELKGCLSYCSLTDIDNILRNQVSDQLSGMGFNEIMNNSLTSESYYRDNPMWPLDHCVSLINPLSSDLSVMRQTLLYGGLESIAHNINRKQPDLMMYEFGNVYFRNPAVEITAERPLAPFSEESRLALWMTGNARQASWLRPAQEATVYDLKAVVLNLLTRLGLDQREYTLTQAPADSVFAASLLIATRSGKPLGALGILQPAVLRRFDIKQPVAYAALRWNNVFDLVATRNALFTPLAKTQAVKRDLALLLDKTVSFDQVVAVVRKSEKRLLRDVALFDVYEGKNLPEGKKSYAISMTLQDDEKTLQDKQIDAVMNKIIANLQRELGAQLR